MIPYFTSLKMVLVSMKKFSYEDFVAYMYQSKNPSSLGIIRLLYGLLMMLDLPEERGGSDIWRRFGNPEDCHFPLFDFLKPLSYEWMAILYGMMFLGTLGIMVGFRFRISALLFLIPYWYIFLLDKSFWNNHTYLYGIVAALLLGTSAHHYCSIDAMLNKNIRNKPVPRWNYLILKFQFFMLYFLAGIKKTDWEWLEGYAMKNMGGHWVFVPFRIVFTPEQIDFFIIHWFGFILDLTIGFWMLFEITRPVAMIFCTLFHLMNSRMFSIGMFPYVCLATMPLFCEENWPMKLKTFILPKNNSSDYPKKYYVSVTKTEQIKLKISWKHKVIVGLLLTHCLVQTVLPFSHSITKGYNNWTKGLYGYSWDMMIHGWNTILVVVKVVDNDTGQEHFLDSSAWTLNDRWTKHADMCLQYSQCVKRNLAAKNSSKLSNNISIYIDVWCSMNGRIQQRMFDPNYDLLKAKWSITDDVEWLLPLLSEYSGFRKQIADISEHVYSWSNSSDVIFVSDFPGLSLENYVSGDLRNVSLSILEGTVLFETEELSDRSTYFLEMVKGDRENLDLGHFHRIHTIGHKPSLFMYTYTNLTKETETIESTRSSTRGCMYSPFPLVEDIGHKLTSFKKMFSHICTGIDYVYSQYLGIVKK